MHTEASREARWEAHRREVTGAHARAARRRAALRARAARWAPFITVLLLLAMPRVALASAPMCDPSGASMPAPPPAPPSATGELWASGRCAPAFDSDDSAVRPGQETPRQRSGAEAPPDRAVPASYALSVRAGHPRGLERTALPPLRDGYGSGIYRPPRA